MSESRSIGIRTLQDRWRNMPKAAKEKFLARVENRWPYMLPYEDADGFLTVRAQKFPTGPQMDDFMDELVQEFNQFVVEEDLRV